jgi:hypothetical protein
MVLLNNLFCLVFTKNKGLRTGQGVILFLVVCYIAAFSKGLPGKC